MFKNLKHFSSAIFIFLLTIYFLGSGSFAEAATAKKLTTNKKASKKVTFTVTTPGTTSLQIDFSKKVNFNLSDVKIYSLFPPLKIKSATANFANTSVFLDTEEQQNKTYFIQINPLKSKKNKSIKKITSLENQGSFDGKVIIQAAPTPVPDTSKPYVVGAISLSNTSIVVGFSEAMDESVLSPFSYQIVQENVNPEVGNLRVLSVQFADPRKFSVMITTASQNEVTYRVTAVNCFDVAGNSLEARRAGLDVLVDPTSTTFAGTPPGGSGIVDTDGDFLSDNEELRGWEVTTLNQTNQGTSRQVTSDPYIADTDGDGLLDGTEKALVIDPRDADTDNDELSDYQEFNETFSDPTRQDTDGDSLYDGLEFNFFKTSPLFDDTDGDQLDDAMEVSTANRNPRIADLPSPSIEIGDADLRLDVRFTATSTKGSRLLEARSEESTLQQTDSKTFSQTDSTSETFKTKVAVEQGWTVGQPVAAAQGKISAEASYTDQWDSSVTSESAKETQKALSKSLNTEKELTSEETLTREVAGASMKVGVIINNRGNLAYRLKNLQLVAFIQDPRNPAKYIPIATLNPDVGTPAEFAMGPLIPKRGPFIFVNDQIFPSLVENLMLDPRGLIFKVSNYDLEDELGRNFAFTSQDINDRTAPLTIDFGGADLDGDGIGESTERYRVATSSGRVIDTNGDGIVDGTDRRVTFDLNGKQVGILLTEAMESILGLTHYDEDETPSGGLSEFDLDNSYSTKKFNGVPRLWRVRRISQELSNPLKQWIILTANGILSGDTDFSKLTLSPDHGITLSFAQDLDHDALTAAAEYMLSCSDTKLDTDGDGLTDTQEVYKGWIVEVKGKGAFKVYSSCARTDSDADGLSDAEEASRVVDVDTNNDGAPDVFGVPAALDPRNPDTDKDGISDYDEINGYSITLRFPEDTDNNGSADLFTILAVTDPLNPDTDGDTIKDGEEFYLKTNPQKSDGDKVFDNDGDGLRNFEETSGYSITFTGVSTSPNVQGTSRTCSATSAAQCGNILVTSDINDEDSDNDGLTDKQEKTIGTHPRIADTDGDGLKDGQEVTVTFPGGVETITNITDPLDADTDNDMRSDGDEKNIAWTVSVVGQTPYPIKSDPLVADHDLDNLVDGQEFTLKTDPELFDTDSDGISDKVEIGATRLTNPLEKDEKVKFSFTNIKVTGDCEPDANGDGEFRGSLLIQNSPTEAAGVAKFDLFGNIAGALGTDYPISGADRTFILRDGDTVIMKSSGLCEEDDSGDSDNICDSNDESLTDFSESFPFVVSSTTKVTNATKDADCSLAITIVATVINN
jgi:hypothetical protein